MLLAVILLALVVALLWMAWQKFFAFLSSESWLLFFMGFGAMMINLSCVLLLAKFRHHDGSFIRVAFLLVRNDVVANIVIVVVGLIILQWRFGWFDLLVGFGIAIMNADAAKSVW